MFNVTLFMSIAGCYCKQAAICIEGHGCYACRVLANLKQPFLVLTIPDVYNPIAACSTCIVTLQVSQIDIVCMYL